MAANKPESFFTNRDEVIAQAITDCTDNLLTPNIDGNYVGTWILTEISLWGNDKERMVVLSTKTITMVKYDFIAMKPLESRKILLENIDTIFFGDLVYPAASLVPARNMKGVRLMWNKGVDVPFLKKWNPFSKDFPFVTYTSHPLIWHKDVITKHIFDVEDFIRMIILSVEYAEDKSKKSIHDRCQVEDKPVILENYVGVSSIIHNRSGLGFFKVRGKFSF